MGAPQSALIVPVPRAEEVVAEHRRRFDPSSPWGVPAHVTVLYPFVDPDAVDDEVVRRLEEAVGGVPAFDCVFRRCGWFDEDVLWLAPEPDEPFRALTAAVWRAFPQHPPYGGAYPDVVPHLTVGQRPEAELAELLGVEELVSAVLPVRAYVDRVHLLTGAPEPDSWRTVHEVPLGR